MTRSRWNTWGAIEFGGIMTFLGFIVGTAFRIASDLDKIVEFFHLAAPK